MKFFSSLSKRTRFILTTALTAVLIVVAGFAIGLIDPNTPIPYNASQTARFSLPQPAPSVGTVPPLPIDLNKTKPLPSTSPKAIQSPQASPQPVAVKVKTYFGHLPYQEADPARLETVGQFVRGTYERSETLDVEATEAFRQMVAAAKLEGIELMPISGFRTIADQKELFEKQVERRGSVEAAAKWSAPPGHSEHHTGYAIDIGDMQSDTDLKLSFQDTDAYRWLQTHAQQFGFEQSFPQNNQQGVSFEPWHWRYVKSARATAVFSAAKSLAL